MPQKRYLVTLTPVERRDLGKLVSAGKRSARTLTHARMVLKADQAGGGPGGDDARIEGPHPAPLGRAHAAGCR